MLYYADTPEGSVVDTMNSIFVTMHICRTGGLFGRLKLHRPGTIAELLSHEHLFAANGRRLFIRLFLPPYPNRPTHFCSRK